MKTANRKFQPRGNAFLLGAAVLIPATAFALGSTPTTIPLFTSNAAKPNILMPIDDSPSMDFEMSTDTAVGHLWWNTATQSFATTTGELNFGGSHADGTNPGFKRYVYLFPNGFSAGYNDKKILQDTQSNGDGRHYAVAPTVNYAFARSPAYNKAYYDPTVTYQPWFSYGTTDWVDRFPNSNPTAARWDPLQAGTAAIDLTQTTTEAFAHADEYTFRMFQGAVIPKDTRYRFLNEGSFVTATSDVVVQSAGTEGTYKDVAITYHPATYYMVTTSGSYQVLNKGLTSYDCADAPVADNYKYFHDEPTGGVGSGFRKITGDVAALGPDGRCLREVKITDPASADAKNFANWFTYYRRRHHAMRGAVGHAFNGLNSIRVKAYTIKHAVGNPNNNAGSANVRSPLDTLTMQDFDNSAERNSFYADLYSMAGALPGGTPNRQALAYAGQQYARTDGDSPIQEPCQKNFTILFTDGYSNVWNSAGVNDADGDGYSNTMADIAMYYYKNHINSNFNKGEVPIPDACGDTPLDPTVDCNKDLHMATYSVVLNTLGKKIFGITHNTILDAHLDPPPWYNPANYDTEQVDDLYHACVNGKGDFFNADTPANIKRDLKKALDSITAQIGSASAVAFNTAVLSAGSVVYQARFNTSKWKGQLFAFKLNASTGKPNGTTADADASENIPAHGNRNIVTFNPVLKRGFQFHTDNKALFSTVQGTDMSAGLVGGLTVDDMINFIRGDRGNEAVGKFRVRDTDTVLGDIVHSAPIYVGRPALHWPDGTGTDRWPYGTENYSYFQNNTSIQSPAGYADRTGLVYVGANDGMLHGFLADPSDGLAEKFAYIPHSLFKDPDNNNGTGVSFLANAGYNHRFYVDETPTITDAYVKGRTAAGAVDSTRKWRTVMVGGLRGGGRGIFALDITDPGDLTVAKSPQLALWEFDSKAGTGDTDMGYSFSRPAVVPTYANDSSGKMRWAAIMGNGFYSKNCTAKLFILFMDGNMSDGSWDQNADYSKADYIEIDTGTGGDCANNPNGLGSPTVIDLDGDRIADRVYAGDLKGNMWVFDICGGNNNGCTGSGWGVANTSGSGNNATPAPLFTAVDVNNVAQPITVKPAVIKHPEGHSGQLILFGTGAYLEEADKKTPAPPAHSFYGIWDDNVDGAIPNGRTAKLERDDLMQQIYENGYGKDAPYRITGVDTPDYLGTSGTVQWGWFLELPDTSDGTVNGAPERVVTTPKARGKIIFFNTLVPTPDACDVGGYGYLMSVLTKNGGRPDADTPIVDINGDGTIDDKDLIDGKTVVGKKTDDGILSDPAFLSDQRYTSTSTNKILVDKVDSLDDRAVGRYSWEELRKQPGQ